MLEGDVYTERMKAYVIDEAHFVNVIALIATATEATCISVRSNNRAKQPIPSPKITMQMELDVHQWNL